MRRQTAGFGVSVRSGYDAHACASGPSTALPRQTLQTVLRRITRAGARDSELSTPLHFASHGAGDRRVISTAVNISTATPPIRHRLRSDSVPVAETSETRELRISLRSHALSRVSSKWK
jgi:hypothetical protein